ncbi:DUF4126 domain-containing protein [Geothrix sp. PMB-07]|uniref:DUF4126 domain-containing protein n=1 Tax=Geothrix sp. PMB-07 TaxID=3068640 RepID=UPI002740CB31|nr:DUF4126 domain-containing protein [Geothrix sp. PMB-07]WLT31209.1 DUF4126 domain-containing protein [Geothrix sp. PMB-07]
MNPLQTLVAILGLSTVSGINLYLTVLLVGLGQRFGWIHGLPPDLAILSHPLVLAVAGLLFLLEFLADKVPFVTPLWDGVHTFIRPVGGALLALGAAADLHPVAKVLAMLAGGTIALSTHGSKMGLRLLAHVAPEPTSHIAISVAEDVGVVALLALAYSHPAIALAVLAAILLGTALLLPLLRRSLVLALHGCRSAMRALAGIDSRPQPVPWVELAALEQGIAPPPENPSLALPCFARRVKGVPRFQSAYLTRVDGHWHLIYRRWFRTRSLPFEGGPLRTFPGFPWDRALFLREGKPQLLLLGREWRRVFQAETGAQL